MKQFTLKLIALLLIALTAPVFAQATLEPDIRTLFTPQLWAVLFGVLSTLLTFPVTGILKRWFKTEGLTTQAVNITLNTLLAGLLPWFGGLYPATINGFLYALLSSIIGIVLDKLTYISVKQIQPEPVGRGDQ